MNLLIDFFNISSIESNGDEIVAKVSFNANHPIYKAHFPGNPITPGVCLLQIVTEILEKQLEMEISISQIKNVKFFKPVGPQIIPSLIFKKMIKNGNQLSINISIESSDTKLVKMSLVYQILNNA